MNDPKKSILDSFKAIIVSVLSFFSAQLSKLKRTKSLDTTSDPSTESIDSPISSTSFLDKAKQLGTKANLKARKVALIEKSKAVKDKAKESIDNKEGLTKSLKETTGNFMNSSKTLADKAKSSVKDLTTKDDTQSKTPEGVDATDISKDENIAATKDKLLNSANGLKDKLKGLKKEDGVLGGESLAKSKDKLLNTASGLKDKFKGLNKEDGLLAEESLAKSKDKLLSTASGLKDKFKGLNKEDGLLGEESLSKSKDKIFKTASSLKDKLASLKDSDSTIIQQLKSLPAILLAFGKTLLLNIKKAINHIRNADVSEVGRAASPIFTKWSQLSLKIASLPWITSLMDKWMALKLWSKEKLFYRYTMPTLVGICGIFLIITSLLFFKVRSGINGLYIEFGTEMVESRTQEKILKYTDHVNERSDEIEQILRDNVNKTSLIANSPTFQELNVQGMEKYSRTLLQKDTNLLNVVVLTHEEVKANIRTRRIGEETDFIFSCCELNEDRSINYEEIIESEWLSNIDTVSEVVTEIYRNPVNNERFFYHGSNITDIKGTQNGAVLLRYNLNFAVRNLQKTTITGVNFLLTNDSTIIASSLDTIYPKIKTLSMTDASSAGPVDYFSRIAQIMNKSKTSEQAIAKLTDAKFIGDPVKFERKFGEVLPGKIAIEPNLDTLGNGTWLTEEQAEAILGLTFGQILKLNTQGIEGNFTAEELEMITGRQLATAYLDSIQTVGNGYIIDEDFLLTFSTNEFGWTLINQSTSDEFYADINEANQTMKSYFGGLNRNVSLSFILMVLLSLLLFSLLITGLMRQFTKPIHAILEEVQNDPGRIGAPVAFQSGNEMEMIGKRFQTLNKEIESYVNKLEQSNTELEQYAQVVSHDLRAPLRTIGSFTQLLEKKLETGEADEKAKSYMSIIQKGAGQMEEMIKGMLSYATIKRKLATDDYQEIDLNLQLQNALDNLKDTIDDVKPDIRANKLPVVRFKSANVVSVFQNLIDNAIKYRKPELPLVIDINAEHIGENYIVSIKDNGIGIDDDSREKVFDMFYRTGDQAESIGIGLATCKKIMDSGGGKIWIDKEEVDDVGTTFFISFPNGVSPQTEELNKGN